MRRVLLYWEGITVSVYIDGRYEEEKQKELMDILESYMLIEDFIDNPEVANILADQ